MLFVSFSTGLQTGGLPSQTKLQSTPVRVTCSPHCSQEQEPEPEISCSRGRRLLFFLPLQINHYLSYLTESRRSNMRDWECLQYLAPIPQEHTCSHLVAGAMSSRVGDTVSNSLGKRNQSNPRSPTSQPQPPTLLITAGDHVLGCNTWA